MSNVVKIEGTEQIDDVVLLLEMMIHMGWYELLNRHLERHWKQTGLELAWVALVWISYIVSQGDHRKVSVQGWVEAHQYSLERVCGVNISGNDLNDDRLSILLHRLSESGTWSGIERDLSEQSIEVYSLETETLRLDATTVSSDHLVSETGLFQFGHSKDNPNHPQVKLMQGSLDPLGMPLLTQVVSGEQADDRLYIPAMVELKQRLRRSGLLDVGDCKMSALEIRAHVQRQGDYYLCPLPLTGKTPELLDGWIDRALTEDLDMRWVERADETGELGVIAEGYEVTRDLEYPLDGPLLQWQERVLIVYCPTYAHQQSEGLERRLQTAQEKLLALTPPPTRGKRVFRDLAALEERAQAILVQHRVLGLLQPHYEPQNLPNQPSRYRICQVTRLEPAIHAAHQRFGWRPYVTNAPEVKLDLADALLTYRDEWRVENGFRRLKGVPLSVSPLFVQRDDQVQGLLHLLSLALRLLTLMQFVVRRHLKAEGTSLVGLYPGNPNKKTDQPTAERLLRAFSNLTLTILQVNGQFFAHAPPLSLVQMQIIQALGLPSDIYSRLGDNLQ